MSSRGYIYRKSSRIVYFIILLIGLCSCHVWADIGISTKFFAEAYDETINFHREGNNMITMAQVLEGIRVHIPKISTIDLYLKQRYGSDANRDYWNNRGELMLGTRMRFFKKIYFALFYEYIQGKYFDVQNSDNPNPYGSNYEDMRYGLLFWQGFDAEYTDRWTTRLPLTFWDEIYADAIFYKKDSNNFISYLNIKAGARLIRLHKTVIDVYAVNYFSIDKHGDFWNNKFEFGVGLRIKPWTDLELGLFVESLKGAYMDRDGRYVNPYDESYDDVRFGVLFWHGIGF